MPSWLGWWLFRFRRNAGHPSTTSERLEAASPIFEVPTDLLMPPRDT
jgi:hypothetical protein